MQCVAALMCGGPARDIGVVAESTLNVFSLQVHAGGARPTPRAAKYVQNTRPLRSCSEHHKVLPLTSTNISIMQL